MSRQEDIDAVLAAACDQLAQVRKEYMESLEKQCVPPSLTVKIKNFSENLRSALDYLACEIAEKVLTLGPSHKTYFPVACENRAAFDKHIKKNLPRLECVFPALFAVIERLQHYNASGCKALPRFSKLVNENKHHNLSPQKRTEKRALRINFPGGAGIVMGSGAGISGAGVISSGDGWFSPAGGTVSGDSPATVGQNVEQIVERWVSYTFDATGDDALALLDACEQDVRRSVTEVGQLLWP